MNCFSIIIPAHNEEGYITKTLKYASSLKYPKDKFEIIVVENGSNDKTLKLAKSFSRKNIRVFSTKERGVSRARNFGATKARFEWLIFLDADTLINKWFLKELNSFIVRAGENYIIGITENAPSNKTLSNRLWYKYHNFVHKTFKVSASPHIVKKSFFDKVKYDERLNFAEDNKFIRDMLKHGRFFYLPTKNVTTSTRRVDKVGHFKQVLKWTGQSFMPYSVKVKKDYEVIR